MYIQAGSNNDSPLSVPIVSAFHEVSSDEIHECSRDLFFGSGEIPLDLYWTHQIVEVIKTLDPKIFKVQDYFLKFSELLCKKNFDPQQGLIDLVVALHCATDQFCYSSNNECLLSAVRDLDLILDPLSGRVFSFAQDAHSEATWEALIVNVWNRVHSSSYLQRCDQRKRRATRRRSNMESYVLKVLEKYRRLLVLRVDLEYRQEFAPNISEQEARADLARLFANRRHNRDLLPDLVGYVCCIEWSVKTRYHFHVLFMLDGDLRRSDAHLAQYVGNYWVNVITKGKGRFFNCNLSKHDYPNCGIGMIHLRNEFEVNNLLKYSLGYIVNKDQYLVAKCLEHSKTVFRGEL